MLARRFLWIIAILIFIVIGAAIAYRLAGDRLLVAALAPDVPYAPPTGPAPDPAQPAAWAARPDLPDDPSRWRPVGMAAGQGRVAVFFVAPTVVFDRNRWNGDIAAPEDRKRLDQFLRFEASAFAAAGPVWSPRYRQATFGAFLKPGPDADKALDLAYADVARAFAAFLAAQPADAPILLAGHSQGALHLMRLLKEQVAGKPLARRIVAAYLVGWPVSITADLPALGLPACTAADQTGCILSWQSFAEPADPALVRAAFDAGTGLAGLPRRGTAMLCTNPVTGTASAASAPADPGSLIPDESFTGGELVSPGVPARCRADGLLSIGQPPGGYKAYVLPGNNFHVYDVPLFWSAVRADALRRAAAFK